MAARPNFMKVAPLYHVLERSDWCRPILVHTGQHYDFNMSDAFIRDLQLPAPEIHLGIGSGSHAEHTAAVMVAYEKICVESRPDWVVVVGDVNSTLACALVAAKQCLPLAHLEAGLRSRDPTMPEEVNRIVTDRLSDVLWTPSPDADENLRQEGTADNRISRVGNIMIDAYELLRDKIAAADTVARLALEADGFGVVTLHRPANVDRPEVLGEIVEQLRALGERLPIVFPVHPRTAKKLEEFGLREALSASPGVRLIEPMGYVEFMSLVTGAKLVLTDSGGLQEETTYLDIPCLTLRPNTERPITIQQGTNRLVDAAGLPAALDAILAGEWPGGRRPALWDGRTAERVGQDLAQRAGRG